MLCAPPDFIYRVQQLACKLRQDRIRTAALWLENCTAFSCALLACLEAKVDVLLPPNLLAENRRWVAKNADLFLTKSNFTQYALFHKLLPKPPHFTLVPDIQNQTQIRLKTSGSRGEAKIVVKTAQQMWHEAQALREILPFNENIYLLGSVSTQHLYGLTFRVFLPLVAGWRVNNAQLLYPDDLIAASCGCQTTEKVLWISSPTLLTNLNLADPALMRIPMAGIISSGGALPEACGNAIRRSLSVPVVEIYGSSETGVIARRTDHSFWQPMPESRVGRDKRGALWVESPWFSGREQTEDAVEMSVQGFRLLGRLDRIVKAGDKRVSLVKIERDLSMHPYVRDCYVGLHPEKQRPVAWIALTEAGIAAFKQLGRKALITTFRTFLAPKQEAFALPRFWRFCEQLPRDSQAKIRWADFAAVCRAIRDEVNR